MIQVITTYQLAEELNLRIKSAKDRKNHNPEAFFWNEMYVDLVTAIDEKTIRLDFHWSEQQRPIFIEYATEDWVQLTDEIEAFVLLKKLNTEMLQYSQYSDHEDHLHQAQYILELQSELLDLGYETMCHHNYTTADLSLNKARGRFYYTIQRDEDKE